MSVAMPTAQALSQYTGVVGCGYPKSSGIVRSIAPSRPLMKSAAYSASATEATTTGMRCRVRGLMHEQLVKC